MSRRFKTNAGKPLPCRPSPAEVARFLSFVKYESGSQCWIWTGFCDDKGYGKFKWRGIACYANRFSAQTFRGQFKPGDEADHKDNCRNPSCVNPDHLRAADRLLHCADSSWKAHNLDKPPRQRKPRPLPPKPDDDIPF